MRQLKISQSITNRDSASLEKYLQDVAKESMITADEEPQLARRIHNGDQAALDKLVRANLRFVVSVAKQYQNQGLSLLDLINEGNLGLIKAAKKFDETKGFKFISYAVWWIRQSILQALAEQARIVRLPLNKLGNLNKIKKALVKFEQEFEREATLWELSQVVEMGLDQIIEILPNFNKAVSIDAHIDSTEDSLLLLETMTDSTTPATDQRMIDKSRETDVSRSLNQLSPTENEILRLFYGIGHPRNYTLAEIAVKKDMTRERVRQIKESAIKRLRQRSVKSNLLKQYV